MQPKHRDTGGPGQCDLAQQTIEMLDGIGQVRQHRCHHHVAVQAGVANRRDQPEAGLRGGRTRLDLLVQFGITDRARDCEADWHLLGNVGDQRQVTPQQPALGQNRHRRARPRECADDPRHQRITPLGALIGIGVGAQRYGLAAPRPSPHLAAQHVGDVRLDDDLGVEVVAAVQIQVFVSGPGETIAARMRTTAVAVDRVFKGQDGSSVGNFVQRGLTQNLVECDAIELRRPHAADETNAFQSGQRAVIDLDVLAVPPHIPFERLFDQFVNPAAACRRRHSSTRASPICLRRPGCHLSWSTVGSHSDDPDNNRNLKWAMGAVGAVAVLATVVAVVLLFGGGGSGVPKGAQSDNGSGQEGAAAVASAKDTGPVAVITEDPSCAGWASINNELAHSGDGLWNERDRSVPASAWTPKLRAQFIAAAQSMRGAAAQAVGLVKLTPHRVMRELYQQFIAYARAYAERVPKYTPADNNLAGAANSASSALGSICAAITDGPAAARGPLVPPAAPPSDIAPVGNPANPQPFLTTTNPVCDD